jgi:endonuclease YncB( thermonuclease family)
MSTPFYRLIPGSFVLIGKEPDGDSVRFRPDHPDDLKKLARSSLIQPSKDGTVQLRFDGIDATELHYGSAAQPFGVEARDALLKEMGWTSVTVKPGSTMVTACVPTEIKGAILSKAAEANGRPVSFVLVGEDAKVPAGHKVHGWTHLDGDLLKKTMNFYMLKSANAYPTFYTSLAEELRAPLRELALAARGRGAGIWAEDSTPLFRLDSQADIDAQSHQPILPKLFRRATDYLKDVAKGYVGNLSDWIKDHEAGSRSEDDKVEVSGVAGRVPLSSLLDQRNEKVAFLPDLMDVVFVEK